MEKQKTQGASDVELAAQRYAGLARQIKELEKQAKPLADIIKGWAADVRYTGPLGPVFIELRRTLKASVDQKKVTPDWLYRMQSSGRGALVEVKVGKDAYGDGDARSLLLEVGYEVEEVDTYAIKL
jgi:hypothetical protein